MDTDSNMLCYTRPLKNYTTWTSSKSRIGACAIQIQHSTGRDRSTNRVQIKQALSICEVIEAQNTKYYS